MFSMRFASLVAVAAFIATVLSDESAIQTTKAPSTSLSLEEIMLLADAAEKVQKKNEDENPSDTSNFQHRLKQILQTARVAAGSGQSTGSDVLDQTIRQVRARINANNAGPSVSDTSIFDAALSAFGSKQTTEVKDPSTIVDAIVKQLSPENPTTPPPQDDSFLGGVIKQIAQRSQEGGSLDSSSLLDVVVKQLVPSTTTTTTTTTTPRSSSPVLQALDGLIRAYQQGNKDPSSNPVVDSNTPASNPNQKNPSSLITGLQDIFQRIQGRQTVAGTDQTATNPGNAATGQQLLDGLVNQLKPLIANAQATGGQAAGPLSDSLKKIQSAFEQRFGAGGAATTTTASAADVSLEGFEGLIPAGGKASTASDGQQTQTTAAPTPQQPKFNANDALKYLGNFVRQISEGAKSQQG